MDCTQEVVHCSLILSFFTFIFQYNKFSTVFPYPVISSTPNSLSYIYIYVCCVSLASIALIEYESMKSMPSSLKTFYEHMVRSKRKTGVFQVTLRTCENIPDPKDFNFGFCPFFLFRPLSDQCTFYAKTVIFTWLPVSQASVE